jgi:hypothetical protein
MNQVLGLLILAIAQSEPKPQSPDPASVAYECQFEENDDLNFDGWPDGWKRTYGADHPRYIEVRIEDLPESTHGEERKNEQGGKQVQEKRAASPGSAPILERAPFGRCLTTNLNGGNVTLYSPDIEASSTFSYSFEIYVHAETLRQSRVEVALLFLSDDNPRRILQRQVATPVTRTSGWKKIQIDHISPKHPETRFVRVELSVKSDLRHDLTGIVAFDNLRFVRLPRISFSANRRFYVFPRPEEVELTCQVSGVDREEPEILLELFDVMGELIRSERLIVHTQQLSTQSNGNPDASGTPLAARRDAGGPESAVEADEVVRAKGSSYAGAVTWIPKPPGYGFYRARATYVDVHGKSKTSDATFVVNEPRTNRKIGEFGWSLKTRPPVELRDLATLLGDVGVNWLKYPTWYSSSQRDELVDFAKFADRLGTQGITVIGVLDRPPEEILKSLGMQFGDGAAGILAEKQLWGPALDGQMSRLSLMVRHWQLGHDGDESFFAIDNLEEKVADLRRHLEGYGQNTKLTLSWNWLYQPPPAPIDRIVWDNVSFYSTQSPTPDELGRLLSHPSLERTKPWAVIRPLDEERYGVEVRARDLVHQMIVAKQQNAPVIFIHEPIGEHGLVHPDGTPGDLLLPWRTAANYLTNADYRGEFPLRGGSRGYLFGRGEETTLVVWNENVEPDDEKVKERVYLGSNVTQVDLWGREKSVDTQEDDDRCAYQELEVGPLPLFITGIDRGVAMWDITFRFDNSALVTKYGQDEVNGVHFENHFDSALKGHIDLRFPKTWKVDRGNIPISLSAGEGPRREPIRVGLLDNANSGEEVVPLIIELQTEEFHRFKIYRRLRVGVTDVEMEILPALADNGDLVIEVQLENKTDKPLSFKTTLAPEGRRSMRRLLLDAKPGRTILKFVLPDGQSLIGKQINVRAQEIDSESPRVVNKSALGPS